jgi:hypothetical protein
MNKYLITAVRPSGSPNESRIWTPRPGAANAFSMCLNLPTNNKMCWIQPRNTGNVRNIHDQILSEGGLNKVNLVTTDKIEDAPGDGSLESMKQVSFGLGTKYEKASVSCKASCDVSRMIVFVTHNFSTGRRTCDEYAATCCVRRPGTRT